MLDYYFIFRSITGAQRGSNALSRSGIFGRMLRAPTFLSIKGCGYALRVRSSEAVLAAAALRQNGVPAGKIYCVHADGRAEETVL